MACDISDLHTSMSFDNPERLLSVPRVASGESHTIWTRTGTNPAIFCSCSYQADCRIVNLLYGNVAYFPRAMGKPTSNFCTWPRTLMVVSQQLSLLVYVPALICIHAVNLTFPCVETGTATLGIEALQGVPMHNPRAALLSQLGVARLPLLLHHCLLTCGQAWHQVNRIGGVPSWLTLQAQAARDFLNLVHLWGDVTAVKVDVVELVQEVRKIGAT
mmetsp:Transcript_28154/g.51226  ORF Transcript_28154/g.51226 Transcript_28154/m.51226 type:complete len:216 (-) Transcript_28154:199-846(-)